MTYRESHTTVCTCSGCTLVRELAEHALAIMSLNEQVRALAEQLRALHNYVHRKTSRPATGDNTCSLCGPSREQER